jgi:hypothetical protein
MGTQISWKTFLAQIVQPQPTIKDNTVFLQPVYRIYSPGAFEELTGGLAAPNSPLWRASGEDDDVPTKPIVSSAEISLELGTIVDTAFDQDASSELRIEAQRELDTLLEKSDLARVFWQGACLRTLGGTIVDEAATADEEAMRGIYTKLLGFIVDNRSDSPLNYAAKTFLTYSRTGFEHILPHACKEKAVQIRESFADHDPADLESLINGLAEIGNKYRTVLSWLLRDSDEVVDEIEGLMDMLRRGNFAQGLFAISGLPLVMQGGLSPNSPRLADVADSLHHIMLFGLDTHNYECAMAAFAQIRDILPPEKVEYVESNLGTQRYTYIEILARVLQG